MARKTLGIRVERQQATAQQLAEWLVAHHEVDSEETAAKVLGNLSICSLAVSLGAAGSTWHSGALTPPPPACTMNQGNLYKDGGH